MDLPEVDAWVEQVPERMRDGEGFERPKQSGTYRMFSLRISTLTSMSRTSLPETSCVPRSDTARAQMPLSRLSSAAFVKPHSFRDEMPECESRMAIESPPASHVVESADEV